MPIYSISRARAITSHIMYAVGAETIMEKPASLSRVYQYDHGRWEFSDISTAIQRIARYQRLDGIIAIFMSPKGDLSSPERSFQSRSIIDESLRSTKKLGRLADLRQVGKTLFACGDGGQTYRQLDDGNWSPLVPDLFDDEVDPAWAFAVRAPGATGAEQEEYWIRHPDEKEERIRRILLFNKNLQFHALNGPSVESIYFCGSDGSVYHHHKGSTTKIDVPTSAFLLDISFDSEDRVWICGRDGVLLGGNVKSGFSLVPCAGSPSFSTAANFKGKLYLSSFANPRGLFVYDGKIRQLSTGLRFELRDVHTVDAVEDALWVIGSQQIARFDGSSWEEIPFPK